MILPRLGSCLASSTRTLVPAMSRTTTRRSSVDAPALTVRPSSSRTLKSALGITSSITPFRFSSFVARLRSLSSERTQDALRDLLGGPHSVHLTEQVQVRVVRSRRGGHGVVLVEPLLDRLVLVVGPGFELGAWGGWVILQVVDLSSPFVRAAQGRPLHELAARDVDLDDGV